MAFRGTAFRIMVTAAVLFAFRARGESSTSAADDPGFRVAVRRHVRNSSLPSASSVSSQPSATRSASLAWTAGPWTAGPRTAGPWTDREIEQLARQAYLWGWPLVYVHNCRTVSERVPAPGQCGGIPIAPPNQLSMLTDYIESSARVVPCPNQDVIYGFGILDLAREPVVIQVPDFGDRFWLYQLGDQRTNGFANAGKMYGTAPGMYLVVGPDWQGAPPPGIAGVFRCPTRIGFCLPRVFLDDTDEDRQAVQPVINQILAYPLGRYTEKMKSGDWTKPRWFPRLASNDRRKLVVPEKFFDVLPEVLDEVPPLPGEEAMYSRFRQLIDSAARDARIRDLLVKTASAAEAEIIAPMFEFRNLGIRLPYHWTTIANGADFGMDYVTRTAVAKSNIFVNRNHETKYYYQDLDRRGERLEGDKSYQVTFPPGRLPATKGFWSLTLYDDQHLFFENDCDRHSVGTKSRELRFDPDGSLTILVQHEPPAADARPNWLPAPKGMFSLYLRVYWPEESLLKGNWSPPPVVADDDPQEPDRIASEIDDLHDMVVNTTMVPSPQNRHATRRSETRGKLGVLRRIGSARP